MVLLIAGFSLCRYRAREHGYGQASQQGGIKKIASETSVTGAIGHSSVVFDESDPRGNRRARLPRRTRFEHQANCASSVDPASAVTEEAPP